MKICHITTVHQRYDIRIFWKECISAAKAGYEIVQIVNDEIDDEIFNGIRIISIREPFNNRFTRIFSRKAKKKVIEKAIKERADLYHFHDPELLEIGMKLKKLGFRVIYDSHEDVPRQILHKEWLPILLRKPISYLYEKYENKCSKKFDAIVVPTKHIKERFKKLNKSVWEICNYPNIKEINYSGDIYSNLNPGCYVGGLSYTRGIRQIAKATYNAGIELNLCGKFFSRGLENEILTKYKNVKYLGFLGRNEIAEVLINSSMGFVTLLNTPNDAMAYPIKVFEYMAAGIPVIASDFPVYKEIVESNNCGICVDPLDIDAITKAIEIIKENKAYADELRKNGRKAVEEKYNWESQANILLDCYKSIVYFK